MEMNNSAEEVSYCPGSSESRKRAVNNSTIVIETASSSEDENEPDGRVMPICLATPAQQEAIFGSVTVKNSSQVHFGTKTIFNGPVTIKRMVAPGNGTENLAYAHSEDNLAAPQPTPDKQDPTTKGLCLDNRWMIRQQYLILGLFCVAVTATITTLITIFLEKSQDDGFATTMLPDVDIKHQILVAKKPVLETSYIIVLSMVMGVVVSAAVRVVILLTKRQPLDAGSETLTRPDTSSGELLPNSRLRYVTRTEWIAQPVEGPLDELKLPAKWVIIAHTATENCSIQSQCVYVVRTIQTFHIESRKWFDIGYNFLVGGDGSAYIGRGWDKVGAHTKYYNTRSIGIAFVGTFNNIDPPKRQITACKQLIADGVALGKIDKDYKLFGHRQLMSSLSPGDKLYAIIQRWPHWAKNNTDSEES